MIDPGRQDHCVFRNAAKMPKMRGKPFRLLRFLASYPARERKAAYRSDDIYCRTKKVRECDRSPHPPAQPSPISPLLTPPGRHPMMTSEVRNVRSRHRHPAFGPQVAGKSRLTPEHAEAAAEAFAEAIAEHLATRDDILRLEDHHKAQGERLELRIETVKAELKAHTEATVANAKADTLRWMFGALAAQTALIVALVKLLH